MSAPPTVRVPAFKLDFSSNGGPELAPGLHQRETHLHIDSSDLTVFLDQHRSESDEPGAPIGTFQGHLPADMFVKILEYANKERLEELAPPTRGGPGTSVMTISLQEAHRTISKTLTSGDIPQISQLQYFLYQLNQMMIAVRQQPYQAVRVVLTPDPAHARFVAAIENIGKQDVCIFDPKTMARSVPDRSAGVRYAPLPEERPGVTSPPLQWSQLEIAPANAPLNRNMEVIKPGSRLEMPTVPWAARRGSRYVVQASWSDYTGPAQNRGCYVIRGAAFSENLKFTL